ncbi:MAG TPA: phasin family protein [Paraburkholderia sp.]|uniref:phasin family protein n=1 Tax=Paraburkholderia sp. TaxID=1926495 RepID=UPI002B49B1DE|nr:phasin family protein [Paraburkholderia sp.]HKR47908.1 phasin family protein [Paraburkholderia sp.]
MHPLSQITVVQKSSLDLLLGMTWQVIDNVRQLARLNLRSTLTTLSENVAHTKKVMAARGTSERLVLQATFTSSIPEKAQAYSRTG